VGLVIANKRGVSKRSVTNDNPARWRARYGSVTFNQYGREFPCGGMNEAGLVVELMWFQDTEYPRPDERASVATLQWIQYQLDNSTTVSDVIASDGRIRIARDGTASIHFLIADASGACASIEFIHGKMVAHTGGAMPMRALTNNSYDQSIGYAHRFRGAAELPRTSRSLDRFVRAAHMADGFVGDSRGAVLHAFGILRDVAQGSFTKWSIVYDIASRRVYFRTLAHDGVRYIDLADLDFDCDTPVSIIDVNAPHSGDISGALTPYTREANTGLLLQAYSETDFLRDVDRGAVEQLSRFPEITKCTGAEASSR
jgi:choloylglycine hydrolase